MKREQMSETYYSTERNDYGQIVKSAIGWAQEAIIAHRVGGWRVHSMVALNQVAAPDEVLVVYEREVQ